MTVQYRNIFFTITDIETTNVSKAKSQEKASLEKKKSRCLLVPFAVEDFSGSTHEKEEL